MRVVRTIGIVLGVALLTSATLFLLGIVASLLGNMGWLHLGEDQPWMPLIGLEYGFLLGIVIGIIVAVKKARNPTAGIVELILKPLLMRIPRIQVYADYACAWIVLALGVLGILRIEVLHPANAVLDAPLLWILLAMLNLLRLHNGYGVRSLKLFCIGANVAVLALEAARFRMFWSVSLIVAVPILAETLFSIIRNNLSAVVDC